jgi:hypothetical protein
MHPQLIQPDVPYPWQPAVPSGDRLSGVGFSEADRQARKKGEQEERRRLILVRYKKITLYRRNEMSYRDQVSQWEQTVSSTLPHLSHPQAKVLALWSMTMIVVGSCGTTLVGAWLSCTVGGSEAS